MTKFARMTDADMYAGVEECIASHGVLHVPGVYTLLQEHFNNEILENWEAARREEIDELLASDVFWWLSLSEGAIPGLEPGPCEDLDELEEVARSWRLKLPKGQGYFKAQWKLYREFYRDSQKEEQAEPHVICEGRLDLDPNMAPDAAARWDIQGLVMHRLVHENW